jgi:hypothetical protein
MNDGQLINNLPHWDVPEADFLITKYQLSPPDRAYWSLINTVKGFMTNFVKYHIISSVLLAKIIIQK